MAAPNHSAKPTGWRRRLPDAFRHSRRSFSPRVFASPAGYAHRMSGRAAAAQAEWKQVLAVVEKRLAAEPNESLLLCWKRLLQALTGQTAEARAERKLRRELDPSEETGFDAIRQVALGDREAASEDLAKAWPKANIPLRNDLWGDLLYAPWFAAIRDDPRIQAMAAEHKAAIDRALKPGVAATAPKPNDQSAVADFNARSNSIPVSPKPTPRSAGCIIWSGSSRTGFASCASPWRSTPIMPPLINGRDAC